MESVLECKLSSDYQDLDARGPIESSMRSGRKIW